MFTVRIVNVNKLTLEEFHILRNYTRLELNQNIRNFGIINDLPDNIYIINTHVKMSNKNEYLNLFEWNVYKNTLDKNDYVNFDDDNLNNNVEYYSNENKEIKACPKNVYNLKLNEYFNQEINFLSNKIKILHVINKNYDKKMYLYEGIEEFVCWGTNNKFDVYTRCKNTTNNDEEEVINKFPNSLKRIVYGGKYLILPKNVEEFYYFGVDKFYIKGDNLSTINLFIHDKKQNIIIKNNVIENINVLIDDTKDKKCSLKNITFPKKINRLVVQKSSGNYHQDNNDKDNKNIHKFFNCSQFIEKLFLDCDFYLSVINTNINELSFSLKTFIGKPAKFRILDFLPSSLQKIYIDKHSISNNFEIKEQKEYYLENNNVCDKINNNFNIMLGQNNNINNMFSQTKNIISFKNLPNSICVLHFNLNSNVRMKKIKIHNKLSNFVLPSYIEIKNLPIEILKKTLNASYQNKFNMVENINNEYIANINYLNKHYSNITNLKASIFALPNLTHEQIAASEDNPKEIKIINKNELLKNADNTTSENRIKRNNHLNKISVENQEKIINENIEKIINNISRNECNVSKIKFVVKLIKSGDIYKLKDE